jgi:hypothetical protein
MKKTYSRPSLIDFLQNFEEHKKLKKEEFNNRLNNST